jgi:hypothetical protein
MPQRRVTCGEAEAMVALAEAAARRMEEVLAGADNQEDGEGGCQERCQEAAAGTGMA